MELLETPLEWAEDSLTTRGSLLTVSVDELFPVVVIMYLVQSCY